MKDKLCSSVAHDSYGPVLVRPQNCNISHQALTLAISDNVLNYYLVINEMWIDI